MNRQGAEIRVEGLTVDFGTRGNRRALDGLDLRVAPGSTLGVVGRSGSGKSTLAACIVGALRPTSGRVLVDGASVFGRMPIERRRAIQRIPQNPDATLNPRRTVGQTLSEALAPRMRDARPRPERIDELLETVQLPGEISTRYPAELSGGQRQRVAIARALSVEPRLLVADEITAALDTAVRTEVLLLLSREQRRLGFTLVVIAHEPEVVGHLADEILEISALGPAPMRGRRRVPA